MGPKLNRNSSNFRLCSVTMLTMILMLLPLTVTARSPANSTSEESGYFSANNLTSSMLTIVILVVALFFLFGFVSVYIRQCAGEHMLGVVGPDVQTPDMNRRSTSKGLDPATVARFPIMVYSEVKEHKIGKQALECAVCLSEFEDREKLRLLPRCSHVFHPDCIGAWLSGHATCPVCRSNLTDCKIGEMLIHTHTPMSPNPNSLTAIAPDQPPDVTPATLPADAMVVDLQPETDDKPLPLRLFASHSTGHSLASLPQITYNTPDRYTLKLPSHVLHQIMAEGEYLRRCTSSSGALAGKVTGGGEGSGGRGGRGRIRMFVRDVLAERLWGIGSTSVRGVGMGVGGSVRGRLESVKGEFDFEC